MHDSPWKLVIFDRDGVASPRYLGEIAYLGDTQQIVEADTKEELREKADDFLPMLMHMVHEPQDPFFDEVVDL